MKFPGATTIKNGVVYFTEYNDKFEKEYIEIRNKEDRLYTDDQLAMLPFPVKGTPHKSEWKVRAKSSVRAFEYFQNKINQPVKILDLGCGNGWFTHRLASLEQATVLGLDINKTELEQAARVFGNENCLFGYGDLFSADFNKTRFSFITLNACIQYFPDLSVLFGRLDELLDEGGEVHIIDSPFYKKSETPSAKARSYAYYQCLGFESMHTRYFHHCWDDLPSDRVDVLYDPSRISRKILNKLGRKESPFPWIRIRKPL